MIDKQNQKEVIRNALSSGPIPVPDETLEVLHGLFITDVLDVLRSHPGYILEDKLRSQKTTLQLFNTAHDDLTTRLNEFNDFCRTPEFHYRSHREQQQIIENRIRKEILSYSELAHCLQDHCRLLLSAWPHINGEDQRSVFFGTSGLHDFVCGLRTALHHKSMIEADWLIRDSGPNETTHYVFEKEELLLIDGWNARARSYLSQATENLAFPPGHCYL